MNNQSKRVARWLLICLIAGAATAHARPPRPDMHGQRRECFVGVTELVAALKGAKLASSAAKAGVEAATEAFKGLKGAVVKNGDDLLALLKRLFTNATGKIDDEAYQKALKKIGDEPVGLAKGAVKFSDQIDNTLARLTGKAKYSLTNTGDYKLVGGHHPVAKKAFEGDLAYDYQKAFSVKTSALDDAWKSANSGIPQNLHAKVTGQQNSLYTAWRQANPNTKLTIDVMADIEIQAMKNVGIPEDVATGWVVKALEDLKAQGVTEIKNISWNGVN